MDYNGALDYLDSLLNHEVRPRAGRIAGQSIEATRRLLWCMGDPHHAYPVVHVTGTNGKGSTVRMTARLLRSMGLRVGVYTSPHLIELTERIEVDEARISASDFGALIGDVERFSNFLGIRVTWFEAMTAAALAHFANVAVDAAVVEVGMLGRFDATNAVDGTVAVLTNVGMDHAFGREDWRRAIAEEKAGIVKPSSTVVCGETHPTVQSVFRSEQSREMIERGRDFRVIRDQLAVGGRLVDLHTPHTRYEDLYVSLHGGHQAGNASLAVTAAEAFFNAAIPEDTVAEALAGTTIPGRFEIIERRPLVVLDAAHNPDGARSATQTLSSDFAPAGRRILVVGFQNSSAIGDIIKAFDVGAEDCVIACTPPSARRGAAAVDVADLAAQAGALAEVRDDPREAFQRARSLARPDDAVMVSGSFAVVGSVRSMSSPNVQIRNSNREDACRFTDCD